MVGIAQISNEEIRALGLTPAALLSAMARAVDCLQRGDAEMIPKVALHPRAGGEFYAMPASLGELAVVKWLNIAGAREPGACLIQAQLLATHIPSGRVLALMEAEWITAVRTAAISALAAQRLDLGVALLPDSLVGFDRIIVDDRGQTEALMASGTMPRLPRIDQDLATLTPMRPGERVLFVPPGMALADAAVAELVLHRLGLWPH